MIPVADPSAIAQLEEVLALNLADDMQSWSLDSDGNWHRIPTVKGIATQTALERLALARSVRLRRRPAAADARSASRRTAPGGDDPVSEEPPVGWCR